ncbi:MAG: PLP-dependent aminotransferase family protein, partial [Nostocoides sp.]
VHRFAASASTVAHALALLTQRGLVETRPGAGTFRARTRHRERAGDTSWQEAALQLSESLELTPEVTRQFDAPALGDTLTTHPPEVIDLNGGYLARSLQPSELLSAALARVSKRADAWERPPKGGIADLRDWFAAEISPDLSRSDILIAPGGQSALATTLRALTQPGDPVILESPTYPGMMAAAYAAGLRPVPVPLDQQGIIPEHLEEALIRSRARVVVTQPLFQNPTGATMGAGRRDEVRGLARAHAAYVIEDDFARYLAHDDAPRAPAPMICDDPDGTVIHLRSLTKPTSPNLRVAALGSRGPVTTRLLDALTIDAFLVPSALQHTALDVVSAPAWRRARRTLGADLYRRRDLATTAIARGLGLQALPRSPQGGYHLWIELPPGHHPHDVARTALTLGVAVTPGSNYYLPGVAQRPHIRVSYVSVAGDADLERGIELLSRAVAAPP